MECGAASRCGVHPDAAAMRFYDLLADCEAYPGPGNFAAMEPFKQSENLIRVAHLEADAVVLDNEFYKAISRLARISQAQWLITPVFQRICCQILENLSQLGAIGMNLAHIFDFDLRTGLLNCNLQIL
jgi:hypothetical protein